MFMSDAFRNLWKDIEKSMNSSIGALYYKKLKKKHLEFPLSAWFNWEFLVGDASFELATPAVWKRLHYIIFPFKNNNLAVLQRIKVV